MPHILLRSFHLKIMKSIVLKGGSDGKASVCSTGDPGLIPGLGRSLREGNGNLLWHSCLENAMDGVAWVGYSPWGRKESDATSLSIA